LVMNTCDVIGTLLDIFNRQGMQRKVKLKLIFTSNTCDVIGNL
jgi:hypothetical protein